MSRKARPFWMRPCVQASTLPHACCHGLCATCKVEVTDGEVDHGAASNFALMDYRARRRQDPGLLRHAGVRCHDRGRNRRRAGCRNLPVHDFTGARVAHRRPDTHHQGVWIELDAGQPGLSGWPVHQPGGARRRAGAALSIDCQRTVRRSGEIELNIRRVPGGRATSLDCTMSSRLGDKLRFAGPYGRFFVRQLQHGAEQLPYLFLAGGSGLSSPRSMILDLLAQGITLPITLVNGAAQSVRAVPPRRIYRAGSPACQL
jgi:phenol hydroxylase P5 protein